MNLQTLIDKAQSGPLTPEEQDLFVKELSSAMNEVKERDPEKYLQFLEALNDAFEDVNAALKNVS